MHASQYRNISMRIYTRIGKSVSRRPPDAHHLALPRYWKKHSGGGVVRVTLPERPSQRHIIVRAANSNVYSNPKVYDIAFSFRDFASEAAFLLKSHGIVGQGPLESFLEVGCGPARHSILLAEAGIDTCVGVDISKEMIDYAKESAQSLGLQDRVHFIVQNMADPGGFVDRLPVQQVDAAAIMLGTLSHCITNDDAIQTLRNVAACVRPGGTLLVELGHPRDIFQGSFCSDGFVECWEVSESGEVDFAEDVDVEDSGSLELGEEEEEEEADLALEDKEAELRVMVEYGREGDRFEVDRQVLHRTVGLSLFDTAGMLASSTVEVVEQRQFTLQEMDMIARLSGWRVSKVYGDFDSEVSLDAEDAYRMVLIMEKT